ncbi:MAG: hypothetical protein IPP29_01910 [Bacteroidetes bacterium]|nr:hypothetical protein [Bacteroidota bacterium]
MSGAGTVVNNDFSSSTLPSYMTLQGTANIASGQLNITANSTGQSGSVLVQNTTGLANNDFQIDFDFITQGPAGTSFAPFTAADGLSYSYGDDVVAGTYQNVANAATNIGYPSNSPIGNTAEGGSGTKLKISFDAFSNGVGTQVGNNGGTNYAGVYFMYNCTDFFNATRDPNGVTPADIARGVLAFSPSTAWRATAAQPATPVNTTHVTINMAGAEPGFPNGSTTLTLTGTTGLAQGYVFGPVKVALPQDI